MTFPHDVGQSLSVIRSNWLLMDASLEMVAEAGRDEAEQRRTIERF